MTLARVNGLPSLEIERELHTVNQWVESLMVASHTVTTETSSGCLGEPLASGLIDAPDLMEPRTASQLAAVPSRRDAIGKAGNIFVTTVPTAWEERAGQTDRLTAAHLGERPLAGLRVGVKDNIAVAGIVTTAGSAARAGLAPASGDAPSVALLKAAGATVAGTTNMNEFAYGFTGKNVWFGDVANPWDPARISGGSSSGSAAAVAMGLVSVALGTDTNGSIRVPAALCGVWGFRPTSGRVNGAGVVGLSRTLDTVGPLADTAARLAITARLLYGADPGARISAVDGVRACVLSGFPAEGLSAEAEMAIDLVASHLGATQTLTVPGARGSRAAAQIVTAVEGARALQDVLRNEPANVGPETWARLVAGALLPSSHYLAALEFRDLARRALLEAMADVDVLIAPATPCAAPAHDVQTIDIDGVSEGVNAALGRCTAPFSFLGFPAVSAPIAGVGHLPVGVQIIGKPGADDLLLDLACVLERRDIAMAKRRERSSLP
jgi:Asp-tRNA(Asn)/Glu-tRNA(Gln) amidotransferase A subunit family amidase